MLNHLAQHYDKYVAALIIIGVVLIIKRDANKGNDDQEPHDPTIEDFMNQF